MVYQTGRLEAGSRSPLGRKVRQANIAELLILLGCLFERFYHSLGSTGSATASAWGHQSSARPCSACVAIYQWPENVREGGLIGYGPSITRMYREQLSRLAIKICAEPSRPTYQLSNPTSSS